MRTNWWHWWTWHGSSKEQMKRRKQKGDAPQGIVISALRIHCKRFLTVFFANKNDKYEIFLSTLLTMNMSWDHFHQSLYEWKGWYVVQNCIKKWVEISHMSNGIFLLENFHFSFFFSFSFLWEKMTLSEKCNAFYKCVHQK